MIQHFFVTIEKEDNEAEATADEIHDELFYHSLTDFGMVKVYPVKSVKIEEIKKDD